MEIFDIAIIGGGPSGMMAALTAAKNKAKVVLIEKNNILGRKLLATGNGRCNITNCIIELDNYHGSTPEFVLPVFDQFNQNDSINFFKSINVLLKEEDRGRMFPTSNQAETVTQALSNELIAAKVLVRLNSCVKSITPNGLWQIDLEDKSTIKAKIIILTTGGKAAHHFGSSGDGLFWSKNLSHTIVPIFGSLVPIETVETWPKKVQGIKINAKVRAFYKDVLIAEKEGDLLFTHYGLSGPAIMGISRFIADLVLDSLHKVKIQIDLLPNISHSKLLENINQIFQNNGSKSIINNLQGVLPTNLISQALSDAEININKKSAEASRQERLRIVQSLKLFPATVDKLLPLKEAQVTRGGICVTEVDNLSLASKLVPNLYFAGEILDLDADSGGYNLQWAWSSGYVAGLHASSIKMARS